MFYIVYYDDTILNTVNKVLEAIRLEKTFIKLLNEIKEFLSLNDLVYDLFKAVELIIGKMEVNKNE